MSDLFSYTRYQDFLSDQFRQHGRGSRMKFAAHLGCQSSFVSQVLNGRNDLSMEHALKANRFFEHNSHQERYFMLLVLMSKAGTVELREFYQSQLDEVRENYLRIQSVVNKREIRDEEALYYFSNWLCISVHLLVGLPGFNKVEALKAKLKCGQREFSQALEFLVKTGLVVKQGETLKTGEAHIHMKKGSPYASAAILNTRLKMIEKIRESDPEMINYSSNFTLSSKAYFKLKQRILDFVNDLDELIEVDEPEKFCTIVLDLVEH